MGEKHRTEEGAKKNIGKLVVHSTFTEGHHMPQTTISNEHRSARGLSLKELST